MFNLDTRKHYFENETFDKLKKKIYKTISLNKIELK